jgi:hypothetical protein
MSPAEVRSKNRCFALEVPDDPVARDEALGIVARVRETRQAHRPVRCDQAEAVPQTAPGLADARTLKNDVANATLGQLVAHREARLTGADHC